MHDWEDIEQKTEIYTYFYVALLKIRASSPPLYATKLLVTALHDYEVTSIQNYVHASTPPFQKSWIRPW